MNVILCLLLKFEYIRIEIQCSCKFQVLLLLLIFLSFICIQITLFDKNIKYGLHLQKIQIQIQYFTF